MLDLHYQLTTRVQCVSSTVATKVKMKLEDTEVSKTIFDDCKL